MAKIEEICRRHNAAEVRRATNEAERALLWTGRKSALGSMGRIAPNYYLEDGVVPRRKLPEMMALVEQTAAKHDLPIGNFFHAGDGNIHPTILFDRHDPDANQRALKAADEILKACINVGGTVSGEHGVGTEKQEYMGLLYDQDDLDAMADLKSCFDPNSLFNPGKIFPTTYRPSPNGGPRVRPARPNDDRAVETLISVLGADRIATGDDAEAYPVGGRTPLAVARPTSVEEVSAALRAAHEMDLAVSAWGGGTKRQLGHPLGRLDLVISLERMNAVLDHYPSDLTAAVQAGCTLEHANATFGRAGQMVPLDCASADRATLGGIVASGPFSVGLRRWAYGTVRDMLLGIQVARVDGRVYRRGGLVVKNVAGYDLARLQYGAMGTLGIITQINLRLLPHPECSQAILAGAPDWAHAQVVIENLMASQLQPATTALIDPSVAPELDLQESLRWLMIRFDGREPDVVRELRDTEAWMKQAGAPAIVRWSGEDVERCVPPLTQFFQLTEPAEDQAVVRLNVTPAETVDALSRVQSAGVEAGLNLTALADAAAGVVWLRARTPGSPLPPDRFATWLQGVRKTWPQSVVAAAPDAVKRTCSVWSPCPEALRLMQRIHARFDPFKQLNPDRYIVSYPGGFA